MAPKRDWMSALSKLDRAVEKDANPYAKGVRSPSPSVNFIYGRSHLMPGGYTTILYGPPEGGKTTLTNSIIGQLHKDDPEAIAIKFDAERRDELQNPRSNRAVWGIDEDRYQCYSTNSAELFDTIKTKIGGLCSEGAPIKLIIIDSLNAIFGRRSEEDDTMMTQQRGDDALTHGAGLKWILNTIRDHGIHLIIIAHARAEQDLAEVMRGNKVRMGASYAVQHFAEFFLYVEMIRSKAGREDALGHKFVDEAQKDMMGHEEVTGHRIRVTMKKSTPGPRLRVGEFTLDYNKGIVNQHEEVFLLGLNRGVIDHPSNTVYEFGGRKWTAGRPAILASLSEESDLREAILTELRNRDLAGLYRSSDMAAEQAEAEEVEKVAKKGKAKKED